MKNRIILTIVYVVLSSISQAQIVNIPDTNFKNWLIANSTINTNGDNEIQISEAQSYNGTININSQNINNLKGIESFTNITYLNCSNNQLDSLDVSENTALTILICYNSQLKKLNVSENIALKALNCYYNQLKTLDISENIALTTLGCSSNQLDSLDTSENSALTWLNCSDNQLTKLNVANNNNGTDTTNLHHLNATGNSDLTCIKHDDDFDPLLGNNWSKDATTNWSSNCSVGVTDFNKKGLSFLIFPNPVSKKIHINFSVGSSQTGKLHILSVDGKTLKSKNISTSAGSNDFTLEIDDLTSGSYLIELQISGLSFLKRFIKTD